jgi:hypothetical protein
MQIRSKSLCRRYINKIIEFLLILSVVRRSGLALSIGPSWVGFYLRTEVSPVSETLFLSKKHRTIDYVQKLYFIYKCNADVICSNGSTGCFIIRPLNPRGRAPPNLLDVRLCEPQSWLGLYGEEKRSQLYMEANLGFQAHSQSCCLLNYPININILIFVILL